MSTKLGMKKKAIKKASRADLDRLHGILPLGEAHCDECDELAYTRWYANMRTKREQVTYMLCFAHNEAMIVENKKRREEFGLD